MQLFAIFMWQFSFVVASGALMCFTFPFFRKLLVLFTFSTTPASCRTRYCVGLLVCGRNKARTETQKIKRTMISFYSIFGGDDDRICKTTGVTRRRMCKHASPLPSQLHIPPLFSAFVRIAFEKKLRNFDKYLHFRWRKSENIGERMTNGWMQIWTVASGKTRFLVFAMHNGLWWEKRLYTWCCEDLSTMCLFKMRTKNPTTKNCTFAHRFSAGWAQEFCMHRKKHS